MGAVKIRLPAVAMLMSLTVSCGVAASDSDGDARAEARADTARSATPEPSATPRPPAAGTRTAAQAPPPGSGTAAQAPTGRVFYVDARRGDDEASGRSRATAWRSLEKVNEAAFEPGDTVLFRRGGTWTGPLTLSAKGTAKRPITIGVYGSGPRPRLTGGEGGCVVVEGNHWRVGGLRATRCGWAGFEVGGRHNELADVHADRNVAGVWVTPTGRHNVIRDSVIADNNRMSVNDDEPDNDSGAFGVLLNGDDNLVTGNHISGSRAPSKDYGLDGAAVEVFNGDRNRITHNVSVDNLTFTELGRAPGKTANGNLFSHNVVIASLRKASFLVTRGPEHNVGPVKGTVAVHNSVYLPGRDTMGWICHDGCSAAILKLRNNVVRVGGVMGFADGKGADEAGGVYHGRSINFRPGPGSIVADPRFRSRTDLRLLPGSPALRRGVPLPPSWYGGAPLARDVQGRTLGATPDAGAYQH
jgi:hypothetical protein